MKEWTREERYRVFHGPEEIRDLYEGTRKSIYRQTYHVQPITGLSSDPDGFVCYQGIWHLFYQWCPWGAVHGLKYWYHTASKDLIHWENRGIGMKPDTFYDNRGVHSGSAISEDGSLYVFYTGNHRDEDWVRTPYTCAAKLDDNGVLRKLPKPLFGPRDDYSEHQRDPKVFRNPENGMYYIFLGAQSNDLKGKVLVYQSRELLRGWNFAGELNVPGYETFGGMWECPCIVNLGGKDVLIFSPQYMKLPGRGESTNHNVYLIGSMDYDTLTFTPEGGFRFLDYGFDFYAAQLAAGVSDPDRAVIIAWMGLPDNHYPTAEEECDWEGSMTIPRELTLKDGVLIQRPVSGIESLREKEEPADGTLPEACEMTLRMSSGAPFELRLFTKEDGSGGMTIYYDADRRVIRVNREGMDLRFNQQLGESLNMPLRRPLSDLRIFIDRSSVELFVNGGEETFTSHCYPTAGEHHYEAEGDAEIRIWRLAPSVTDDFVV